MMPVSLKNRLKENAEAKEKDEDRPTQETAEPEEPPLTGESLPSPATP